MQKDDQKMFPADAELQVSKIGETRLLRNIREWLGACAPPSPSGMGDDCAVIANSSASNWLHTTDSLSYGVHFDDSVSAEQAGRKLIHRNLSDIAAMGGTPKTALLSLLCAPNLSVAWLEAFFDGIRESCERHSVQLIGGDISSLPAGQFSAVLMLTGVVETPKLRTGAKAGDLVYVTGTLGGSRAKKHYAFTPRIEEGRWLAGRAECVSMMDLTDGLAKDLPALVPPDCAVHLNLRALPVSADASTVAQTSGRAVMDHVFCDGEDYELLFTVDSAADSREFEAAFRNAFPGLELSRIGHLESDRSKGVLIDGETQTAVTWNQGFEHLSAR